MPGFSPPTVLKSQIWSLPDYNKKILTFKELETTNVFIFELKG